jgi:hypothetical protein
MGPAREAIHRRAYRKEQSDLAAAAGFTDARLRCADAAPLHPRAQTLDRFARLGGVTAEWLLHGRRRRGEAEMSETVSFVQIVTAVTRQGPVLYGLTTSGAVYECNFSPRSVDSSADASPSPRVVPASTWLASGVRAVPRSDPREPAPGDPGGGGAVLQRRKGKNP